MSRGASGAAAAYPPWLVLLTLTNPFQLANICALAVPNIWTGSVQQSYSSADPQRHATFFSFCQRVIKTTQISSACVLLALYYIFQLRAAYPNIQANMGSEVRLFTTALILANKFLDDNTFTNKTWSDVSNIPVKELNIMEREFLTALNHNIAVNDQCYFAWVAQLQNWLPLARIMRPVLTPARLGIKLFPSSTSLPPLATSPSMPHNLNRNNNNNNPITTTTTTTASSINASAAIHAVKRVSHDEASPSPLQRSFKRLYTPPSNSEFIAYHQKHFPHQRPVIVPVNNSCSRTPLYNTPPIQPDYSCRPVLSWSSSSSALASSRHVTAPTTAVYSAASSVATAAAAAAAAAASINSGYPTSLLTHRVQCLRIE